MVSNNMLSDIAFEQIEGNFWYAAYGPFRVVMMKENGYINATKLCSSGGKDYCEWKRLKNSQRLINVLEGYEASVNTHENFDGSNLTLSFSNPVITGLLSPSCKFIQTPNLTDTERIISSTYCHPDLIPSIAGWISPIFQIMTNRVVNGYITQQYKDKLNMIQLQLDEATKSKGEAEEELANQQAQLEMLTELGLDAELAKTKAEEDARKKERRIQTWSSSHAFTMMRLNNANARLPYYAIRRKRANISGAIRKLRVKYPNSVMIYQNSHVPNPVNLYNRLKACGLLYFKGNYCKASVGEAELINKLGELYNIAE